MQPLICHSVSVGRRFVPLTLCVAGLLFWGCTTTPAQSTVEALDSNATVDAWSVDGGAIDTNAPEAVADITPSDSAGDAVARVDAADGDLGKSDVQDSSSMDAQGVDAGASDAASADTAPADSNPSDVGQADVGAADVGALDSSTTDGGASNIDAVDSTTPTPTTIIVHHPQASQLGLRGDLAPLSWSTSKQATSSQATSATFTFPAGAKTLRVKAVLQPSKAPMQWALGANHLIEPGATRHLYPYFNPKYGGGRREDFAVTSQSPPSKRTVRVFLPPGYDENTIASYPLLLLFDGQNIFDAKTATFGVAWQVQTAVLSSLAAGKLAEVVVAAVDHGGAQRIQEYTPWKDTTFTPPGGGGSETLNWLEGTVLPELDKRYRLKTGRSHRIIGGASLGGLMSLFALLDRPKVWGGAMAMSGSWWWNKTQSLTWAPPKLSASAPAKVWLDAGTVKDGLVNAKALYQALSKTSALSAQNLTFYTHQGGTHSEKSWQARVHLPLRFFFDPGDREAPFKP